MNNLNLKFYMFFMINFIMIMFTSSIFLKWMIIEISNLVMIFYLNYKSLNKKISIYYFLISSLTSIILILMLSFKINWLMYNSMNLLFFISMFLKLGIYPFSFWMINSYEFLSWNQIFFMSTFMKIFPIILLNELNLNQPIILYLLFNNLIISIITLKFWSIKKIIACSSINHNFILILLIFNNKSLFIMYSLFYLVLLFCITQFLNIYNITNSWDLNKLNYKFSMIFNMLIIILMMLPPMTFFLMKWIFLMEILVNNSFIWIISFFYLITNMILLWSYFSMIKYSLNNNKYPKFMINYKLIYYILLIIMINLLFWWLMSMW